MDAGHKIQALRSNIERVIKGKPAVVEMAAVAPAVHGDCHAEPLGIPRDVPAAGITARSLPDADQDRLPGPGGREEGAGPPAPAAPGRRTGARADDPGGLGSAGAGREGPP